MNIQYYPLLDTKKDVQKLQDYISKNPALFTDDISQATAILVAWGDGYMMHILKEYQEYNLPFVGVNFGRLGFLMNAIDDYSQLPTRLEELDIVIEKLPLVTVVDAEGNSYTTHMVNDLVIGKGVLDYFCYTVSQGKQTWQIQWTALIVSTAIGSTAYWLSNGGPVMPLWSQVRGMMGIATRPFHHQLVQEDTITIEVSGKSPAEAWVDGYNKRFAHSKHITISPDTSVVRLGFLKTHNFDTKRLLIAEHKWEAQ